jgi:hypothetical protein
LTLFAPRSWPRPLRLGILATVCIGGFAAVILAPRVPLGAGYHDFADKRTLFGLQNALDVLSNIPFVLVGAWGLLWLSSRPTSRALLDARERVPWMVFFAGVLLTGFGSFWYHMAPSNGRLPWDLLPMTCSFISLVVITFMERVSVRAGFLVLGPLLVLGISSVLYWYMTESLGHGDYKFYLFVQFFSPIILALLIGLFPPRYDGVRFLIAAFACYVAAKLLETGDYFVFRILGNRLSGHALKHMTAAVACYCILEMLRHRRPVPKSEADVNEILASPASNLP